MHSNSEFYLQLISVVTNVAVLGFMVKVFGAVVNATKAWTLIEFKVNQMYEVFQQKFERRDGESIYRPKEDIK